MAIRGSRPADDRTAQRRAALDADEARWLREAEALQIWRPLGMVSALDYMERVLGYRPRSAQERLRVARALGTLPRLTAALAQGEIPFSAVRELTRVATPATEAEWCEAATGKNLRQIEDLVAEHRPGDRPTDPPDPEARVRVVRFELSAETFARLRQARTVLDDEHGSYLSDDEFVAALSNAVLDGAVAAEPTGRAKYQIAVTMCERCRQGWQDGAGAKIAIGPAAVERAECDAQHIGSLDGAEPERAYQDVPPSVVRFVWRRDGGRCRVPGCRSARGLEVHHLVHRAAGGGHEPSNLILACSSCHQAHHAGALTITGTADHLEVRRSAEPRSTAMTDAHVGASVSDTPHVGASASNNPHVGATANNNPHVGATASSNPHVGTSANGIPHVGATANSNLHVSATASNNLHVGATASNTPHVGATASSNPHVGATEIIGAHVGAIARDNAHVGAPTKLDAVIVRTQAKEVIGSGTIASGNAHVGAPTKLDAVIVRTQAKEVIGSGAMARDNAHVGAPTKLDAVIVRTQAKEALIGLGWKPAIAQTAVAAAAAALGVQAPLERLIFESLRRCPRPTS